jgi:anti-anti-sigma regulatory factor
VLQRLHHETGQAGGCVAVCGLRPDLAEVLKLTGLNRCLAVYPDVQQALASF